MKRSYQKIITRLKLGKFNLNYYQHQNKFHKDGLCPTCNVKEDIDHHILKCPKYNYIQTLHLTIPTLNPNPTLHDILTNKTTTEALARLIKRRL